MGDISGLSCEPVKKKWREIKGLLIDPAPNEGELGPDELTLKQGRREKPPVIGEQLDNFQKGFLQMLVGEIFTEQPGKARGVVHYIVTPKGCVVREH